VLNRTREGLREVTETRIKETLLSMPLLLLAYFSGCVDFRALKAQNAAAEERLSDTLDKVVKSAWARSLTGVEAPQLPLGGHMQTQTTKELGDINAVIEAIAEKAPVLARLLDALANHTDATEADCERVFSRLKLGVTARRKLMDPDNAGACLMVNAMLAEQKRLGPINVDHGAAAAFDVDDGGAEVGEDGAVANAAAEAAAAMADGAADAADNGEAAAAAQREQPPPRELAKKELAHVMTMMVRQYFSEIAATLTEERAAGGRRAAKCCGCGRGPNFHDEADGWQFTCSKDCGAFQFEKCCTAPGSWIKHWREHGWTCDACTGAQQQRGALSHVT
jgi:hypothetical protein